MEFSDLNILIDLLIQNYFGSGAVLAIMICFLCLIFFMSYGIHFKYSLLFTFPLFAFFIGIGWFGDYGQLTLSLTLIVIAIVYGYIITKLWG